MYVKSMFYCFYGSNMWILFNVFLVELLRRNVDLLNKIGFKGRVWFKKYLFVMKWFCLKVELLEMSWWLIYGFCFFEY